MTRTTKKVTKPDTRLQDVLEYNIKAQFIYCDELIQFFCICALTNQSGMLYGTGGTGKTDMLRACLESIAPGDFTQIDCDSSTTSSKMLGGAAAITRTYQGDTRNKDGQVISTEITSEGINYENGPLNYSYTLFDEILDAMMEANSTLKGVMTLREHGGFKSRHKAFFAATNLDPEDVLREADIKAANSNMAFFKRWLIAPFELPDYAPETYRTGIDFFLDKMQPNEEWWVYDIEEMLSFEQELVQSVAVPEEIRELLANMSSRSSSDKGYIVNFRDIRWAVLKILRASAYLRGASEVGAEDFKYLKYLKAWAPSTYEDLAAEMEELKNRQEQQKRIYDANQFAVRYGSLHLPDKYKGYEADYYHTIQQKAEQEIHKLRVANWTDNFVGHRDRAISTLRELASQAEERKIPKFTSVELD